MARVGILGGTFDPIHNAHLSIARESAARFGLERVLFIPAAHPPHKADAQGAGYEDRFRMVELACGDDELLEPSRLEDRPEPSYSIDTIETIRKAGDEVFFIIGADAFAEIETWRRWRDVVTAAEFVVAARPGFQYHVPEGATVHRLDDVALPESSTEIRRSLAAGVMPHEVPFIVAIYIIEKGLYGFRQVPSPVI